MALLGNGEWWRQIPAVELGPSRMWGGAALHIAHPGYITPGTRAVFGTPPPGRSGILPAVPAHSIYRAAPPVVSLPAVEAANNSGDRGALSATGGQTQPNNPSVAVATDPTFNGQRNLSGVLTPGGLAAVRAGLRIAQVIPGVGLIASILNLGLGLVGTNNPAQVATATPVAPDVDISQNIPAGMTFTDPITGVPHTVPDDPITGIATPQVTPDSALIAAPDPVATPDTVAAPTDPSMPTDASTLTGEVDSSVSAMAASIQGSDLTTGGIDPGSGYGSADASAGTGGDPASSGSDVGGGGASGGGGDPSGGGDPGGGYGGI